MVVRLSDVASRARVSTGLVSKVLNNRAGVRVPEETRRRIVAAAEEMGYRPSTSAASLRSGKTRTVAFVFCAPKEGGRFHLYCTVAGELAHFLETQNHHLLIQPLETQELTLAHWNNIARSRVCDLAVLWGSEPEVIAQGQLLESLGMPFVVKGRLENEYPHWPQIDFDHEQMMRLAVKRLVADGHRQIAYIGYKAQEPFRFRLENGFQTALQEQNLISAYRAAVENGQEVASELATWFAATSAEPPTALIIGADVGIWQSAEIALAQRGKRFGFNKENGEIAVIGLAQPDLSLFFGDGLYFNTGYGGLSAALCQKLIAPYLGESKDAVKIHRHVPEMQPASSFRLQEQKLFP